MKGCKVDTASKFEGHLGPRYIYNKWIVGQNPHSQCHTAIFWGHLHLWAWAHLAAPEMVTFHGPGPTKETALTLDKAVMCGLHHLKWWQIGGAKIGIQPKTTKDLPCISPCWWWNGGEGRKTSCFMRMPLPNAGVLVANLQEIGIKEHGDMGIRAKNQYPLVMTNSSPWFFDGPNRNRWWTTGFS